MLLRFWSNGQALKDAPLWLTTEAMSCGGLGRREQKTKTKKPSTVYHCYTDHNFCAQQVGSVFLASCICELDGFDSGCFSSSDCKGLLPLYLSKQ